MDRPDLAQRVMIYAAAAVIGTFCVVIVETFTALLIGLFDLKVNNDDVFKILQHAFDLIMVSLTSFLGGRASVSAFSKPKRGEEREAERDRRRSAGGAIAAASEAASRD